MKSPDKRHLLAIAIALFALVYSSFFLQGLRLFDNDYNQWLTFAREYTLPQVLGQVFNPILYEWNVDFRPVQTLMFKGLFFFFEHEAWGYYFFKSLMLSLFCAGYFLFLRCYLDNQAVAALSALFVAMASSTFTSLYWVSDFVIVSEFWALLVFVLFLHLETIERPDRRKLLLTLCLMVLLTLICDRTKANGKLIPGILLIYILLFDWRKLKRYGAAIAIMVALLLPWPVLFAEPAPFLVAIGEAPPSYAWQPASLEKLWMLFAGDFAPFSLFYAEYPPISVIAIIGFPLAYLGIAAISFLIYRRTPAPMAVRLMIVWASVNLVALMSYPALPQYFQARYAISALIPLIPLLLLAIHQLFRQHLKSRQLATILLLSVCIIQLGFHTYHTTRMRNIGMPAFMIASDKTREYIADTFTDAGFLYYRMPVFSFRPTGDGNQFFSSLYDDLQAVRSALPQGAPLFIISSIPLYGPALRFHASFPGKSDGLYDRIFNSKVQAQSVTFYLYRLP